MKDVAWLPAMFSAGAAVAIVGSHNWRLAPIPVVILARLSYPMYLGHMLLFSLKAFYDYFGLSYTSLGLSGMSIVLFVSAVVFAYLLSLAIEFPFIEVYRAERNQYQSELANRTPHC